MSLPPLELTTDRRGLPALKLSDTVCFSLSTADQPVTDEQVTALLAQLTADFNEELPDSWTTQAAWDNVIQLKPPTDEPGRAARFALSIYGWMAGAAAAGQSPVEWLSRQLPPAGSRPGQRTEQIWTVLEGRSGDELRLLGAIGDQARGAQAWQALDRNQPLGVRGGHQEIWGDNLISHLTPAVEALSRSALSALWLRPQESLDWPSICAQLKPGVLIDPFLLKDDASWRRLKLELTGRRLATSLWISDELLDEADAQIDLAHGIAWQPTRYQTLTDFLSAWQATRSGGWRALLIQPEAQVDAGWMTNLADVMGADYIWHNQAEHE